MVFDLDLFEILLRSKGSPKRRYLFLAGASFTGRTKGVVLLLLTFQRDNDNDDDDDFTFNNYLLSMESLYVRVYFDGISLVSFPTVETQSELYSRRSVQPILEIVFAFLDHGSQVLVIGWDERVHPR